MPGAVAKALCAVSILATAPAAAQTAAFYSLADLQNIFVEQQQYFVLDNERSANASLNHLHITSLDPTSGYFEGFLWAPVVPPYLELQINQPVLGQITLTATGTPLGNFYGISFDWTNFDLPCPAVFQTGFYTGAITFLGYQGSGKMHALIAGTVAPTYGDCTGEKTVQGPMPFSGTLTK